MEKQPSRNAGEKGKGGRWTLDKSLLSHSWLPLAASCCSLIPSLFSPLAFPQLRSKMARSVGLGGASAQPAWRKPSRRAANPWITISSHQVPQPPCCPLPFVLTPHLVSLPDTLRDPPTLAPLMKMGRWVRVNLNTWKNQEEEGTQSRLDTKVRRKPGLQACRPQTPGCLKFCQCPLSKWAAVGLEGWEHIYKCWYRPGIL